MIGAAVFVVALVCAQEAEEPGQPRIPEEETAPPLSPTDELEPHPLDLVLEDELPPCGPRSEQLYREGFALLAKNDRAEAVRRFNEVLRTCPEHPYAAELRRLAAFYPPEPPRLAPVASNVLVKKSAIPSTLETTRPQVRTRASLLARAELITVQSANGLVAGLMVCELASCDDARGFAATGIAGAVIGGGLSLYLSRDLTAGQISALNNGALWGAWNLLVLPRALEVEPRNAAPLALTSTLLATGIGAGVAVISKPDEGRVSLASSSGIWSGVIALWAMSLAGVELGESDFYQVELAASNGGLVLGAIASRFLPPVSRGHVLLIDSGGLVGMLVGIGAAFLINPEPGQELLGGLALLGTASGLGTVSYLSRNIDEPRDELDFLIHVSPMPRGLAMSMTF